MTLFKILKNFATYLICNLVKRILYTVFKSVLIKRQTFIQSIYTKAILGSHDDEMESLKQNILLPHKKKNAYQ